MPLDAAPSRIKLPPCRFCMDEREGRKNVLLLLFICIFVCVCIQKYRINKMVDINCKSYSGNCYFKDQLRFFKRLFKLFFTVCRSVDPSVGWPVNP